MNSWVLGSIHTSKTDDPEGKLRFFPNSTRNHLLSEIFDIRRSRVEST